MPLFKLEAEYVLPKVEITLHVEAKDEEEARALMRELADYRRELAPGLEDALYDAQVEERTSAEDTVWNRVRPVEQAPEGVTVVKIPEGWNARS